nr:hypothetical protein [Streptomyces sp. RFCAC02]
MPPTGANLPAPTEDADELCAELRELLGRHGIKLPSLAVDPVTSAGIYYSRPLLELGRCNLDTAARLVDLLRRIPEQVNAR